MNILLQMDQANFRLVDQHTIYSHFKQESLKSTGLIPLQWMFAECFYSSLIVKGIFWGFRLDKRAVSRHHIWILQMYIQMLERRQQLRKRAMQQFDWTDGFRLS